MTGDWKPIAGPVTKSNFESELKTFKPVHHEEEHQETPDHGEEHHHDSTHNFEESHHIEEPSYHHKEEPIREIKPSSWAVSTSNIDFSGNDGNSHFNSQTGNSDFEGNSEFDGSNSDQGGNSVSYSSAPWWKNEEQDYFNNSKFNYLFSF